MRICRVQIPAPPQKTQPVNKNIMPRKKNEILYWPPDFHRKVIKEELVIITGLIDVGEWHEFRKHLHRLQWLVREYKKKLACRSLNG